MKQNKKTILITGSTDGIGYETAKALLLKGHKVLIHGRDTQKLKDSLSKLSKLTNSSNIDGFLADLSDINKIASLVKDIKEKYTNIDLLINNAGVYKTANPITKDSLDVRFAVNTIAPYLLTKQLVDILASNSRVVNLSSAAQAPVNLEALKTHKINLSDSDAYAQSKLALTMWNFYLSHILKDKISVLVAVNPASFLGSKMVKQAYGMNGKDLNIGVDILTRAALSDEFNEANGKYFDNDIGRFALPYPDAIDMQKCKKVVQTIEDILEKILI